MSGCVFALLMQPHFAQLPACKDPSVNAKCDKNELSVILVLGTRASLELRFHRAELCIDGVLEEKSLGFSLLCLGVCSEV